MNLFRSNLGALALVVATMLLASACGGTREPASPLYVDLPEPASTNSGLTTNTTSGVTAGSGSTFGNTVQLDTVAQERFEEVERFYDDYLQLRADSIDRTDPIEVIDAVTTSTGRQEVVEELAYNDSLHTDGRFSAVDALYLYSNVESVFQVDDDTILVIDCTEQHEINVLDQHLVFFPTVEVRIEVNDGEMRVDSYTTTHNGYLDLEAPLGCAPTSFQERAEATAAQAWTDLAAWGQSADNRNDEHLPERIGGPLRERVLDAATQDFVVDEHAENSQFTAAGIDINSRLGAQGAEALIVQVESCHRFPDGRTASDSATQTEVQDLRPGAEQALRFHVLIDPADSDDRLDQVVAIEYIADRCF